MALCARIVEGEGQVLGKGLLKSGVEERELRRASGEVWVGVSGATARRSGCAVVTGEQSVGRGILLGQCGKCVGWAAVLGVRNPIGGEVGTVVQIVRGTGSSVGGRRDF